MYIYMSGKKETKNLGVQAKLSFWKRHYYSYLDSFVGFLVPHDAVKMEVSKEEAVQNKRINFSRTNLDYIVASDVLGHIYDIDAFLKQAYETLRDDGRLVITQYSALWEPVLRLATHLRLRKAIIEQNWLTREDLKNFASLAGFETLKYGSKMVMPIYIPLLSAFLNKIIANIWPFSRLGLFHYLVARKSGNRHVKKSPSLSIIVPARNEAGTIENIVKELPTLGAFTEIIFIEGNSTDSTWHKIQEIAEKYNKKNIQSKKILYTKQAGKGKGDAVRRGFEMATGDIFTIYDADMTVPPKEIEKFYRAIVENKGEFINGSRLVYPLQKESMRVLNVFGNKFFSFAFSAILGEPIKDTLCGTKMLWKKDYENIKRHRSFFGDFDPFGDFDLLFGATKLNLKIIDVPVHYRERTYGATNISRFRHGWLLLKMTVFAARKIKFI